MWYINYNTCPKPCVKQKIKTENNQTNNIGFKNKNQINEKLNISTNYCYNKLERMASQRKCPTIMEQTYLVCIYKQANKGGLQ